LSLNRKPKLIWEDWELNMFLFDIVPQLFLETALYGFFSDNSSLEQDRRYSEVNNSFCVFDIVNCDYSKKDLNWCGGCEALANI
jgi:hypothetical protein